MKDDEISILVIEDEALIAQNIKMQLESFGYHIAGVCYKFTTAIKAIHETEYDVIITDINLGNGIDEKSGLQIVQQVKQIKDCPVIFLTAFSDKETIKKAAVLAPSAYLVKPVTAATLFATVQLAVDNFNTKTTAAPDVNETPDYLFVKLGNEMVKILWKDVFAFEAIKNYVKIKTDNYKNGVLLRGSLKSILETILPVQHRKTFIKINRSEAINKSIILKVSKDAMETTYGNFNISSDFNAEDL